MEEPNRLEQEPNIESVEKPQTQIKIDKEIDTENVTPIHDMGGDYVEFEQKLFQKNALKELRPDLFRLKVDGDGGQSYKNFGTQFPNIASKGDIFVRVDVLPNRAYKFDGRKWIEINKETTTTYLFDQEYIKYLIEKIGSGEYDIELLSENEKEQIEDYLKGNQNS